MSLLNFYTTIEKLIRYATRAAWMSAGLHTYLLRRRFLLDLQLVDLFNCYCLVDYLHLDAKSQSDFNYVLPKEIFTLKK